MTEDAAAHGPDERERADRTARTRRGAAAAAGFTDDREVARRLLSDPMAKVRAAAFASLVRLGAASNVDTRLVMEDPEPLVRRTACELAPQLGGTRFIDLLDDADPSVVEAAAFACGETGEHDAVGRLAEIAAHYPDPLCRESAVAALGAIGDPVGKQTVLGALDDLPAIRRRAVVALAAFRGADVDEALHERMSDRDWQVRQAAADVLGISATEQR